jgi:DNA-binding HxlR family transcriptional regulator
VASSAGDAFLSRPNAVPALLALEKGPLNAIRFTDAAEYDAHEAARLLRDDLEAWGLVAVEPATVNGKAGQLVSLTTAGRKVAEMLRAIGKPALRLRGLRALYALREGPMSTRAFTEATRYTPPNAKLLREDLQAWGVVRVPDAGARGVTHRIELTEAGKKAADLCAEVVRVVERSAKKQG